MQYAEKLGVTNHNGGCYSDKSTYGTDTIETNMYSMMTDVKTLWKTQFWSTSEPSGTLLDWFPVGPNGAENNNGKVCAPIDYFQKYFNYWSGSMIYGFDIVSSQMHTGRLVISYHPNFKQPPADFTLEQAAQQYFLSFDLDKGKGCSILEIPYLWKRPFRAVTTQDPNPAVIPLKASK